MQEICGGLNQFQLKFALTRIRMLINRAALLAQEEESGIVEHYEINKNSLKGFLVLKKQNKEQGKSMAAFFLVDKKTHNGIYFTVISQDKIDAKLLIC